MSRYPLLNRVYLRLAGGQNCPALVDYLRPGEETTLTIRANDSDETSGRLQGGVSRRTSSRSLALPAKPVKAATFDQICAELEAHLGTEPIPEAAAIALTAQAEDGIEFHDYSWVASYDWTEYLNECRARRERGDPIGHEQLEGQAFVTLGQVDIILWDVIDHYLVDCGVSLGGPFGPVFVAPYVKQVSDFFT